MGLGNITNKIILRNRKVPVMSLVVWSALVPIAPFFACSWWFEGESAIVTSLLDISLQTVLALLYLAFFATIIGYAIWGNLLSRYETARGAAVAAGAGGRYSQRRADPRRNSVGTGDSRRVGDHSRLLVNVFGGMVSQRLLVRT